MTSHSLQQLIEQLQPLHVLLAQNSYIKDTTRRLKRLMDDAGAQTMIVMMGKERVGKTTIINALLGKQILSASYEQPTRVNTFIRYGEEPCVKAYFLDGMIATFDLKKVELLTTSTNHSAQVIREHIDYIEVIVKHELLKSMTIVDSVALQVTESRMAYFSDVLLSRMDHVFWVIRHGSPATEAELALLAKYAERGIKPHFLINAVDEHKASVESFVEQEQQKYGELIASLTPISSKYALQSAIEEDAALWEASNFKTLQQLLQGACEAQSQREARIVARLLQWLVLLQKEIQQIPTREPYVSAWKSVSKYSEKEGFEFTRQERDEAILQAYEQEYAHVSRTFQEVETLYQLLQKLTTELYLRDEQVEVFEDVALRYQLAVREYRKLHMEYVQAYGLFDQQHRKAFGKGIEKGNLQEIEAHSVLGRAKYELEVRQQRLVQQLEEIQRYEVPMLERLHKTQAHLTELVSKRLQGILQQVAELNIQRKRELRNVNSSVNKLAEFVCIEEAQHFIRDTLVPYLQSGELALTDAQRQQLKQTTDALLQVRLQQQELDVPAEETDTQLELHQTFKTTYELHLLSLTEADVISKIPECPKPLVLT